MADKYYEKAKNEFDPLIPELRTAGVITTHEQEAAMQQFLDAAAQNISTFVNKTFTPEHPGETMKEATGTTPLTNEQIAEKNRGITTGMVSATFASWVRGPSEGLHEEHKLKVDGGMQWVFSDTEFRLGQQTYGPLHDAQGNPVVDKNGNQVSGELEVKRPINANWASDVLKMAEKYVKIQKDAVDKADDFHQKAESEGQHAKDKSFLYAEMQTRNVGQRGGGDLTVDMLRKEHEQMAEVFEKQAQVAISGGQKNANDLVESYTHQALHGSSLDPDNQQLHHLIPQEEKNHSHHDHHSNASDATRNPMSIILQQMASRDPDAAMQLAQQITTANTQAAQPAMEQG